MGVNTRFSVGGETYILSSAEMLRLNTFLALGALSTPRLPNKFYSKYGDTTLVDLLGLHKTRDGDPVDRLPVIYADLADISTLIVDGYPALCLHSLDMECITVTDGNDAAQDKPTADCREFLKMLQRGAFMPNLLALVRQGVIYGQMFAVLIRSDNDKWPKLYLKDPASIFPQFYELDPEPTSYFVNYRTTLPGDSRECSITEVYEPGENYAYRNGNLLERYTAQTGIDEPTMVSASLIKSDEWYGRGPLFDLLISIVEACGVFGSSMRAVRQQGSGTLVISGNSALEVKKEIAGGDDASKASLGGAKVGKAKMVDPDNPRVLFGKDLTASLVESTVASTIPPYLEQVRIMLTAKCPLFALHQLGANASGYAIKLTLGMLETQVKTMRAGIGDMINEIVRVGMKLMGSPLPDGYKVAVDWPEVFPEDLAITQANLITLQDKGNVSKKYVNRELGIDDPDNEAWLEEQENKPAAEPAANPFGSIFGGQ